MYIYLRLTEIFNSGELEDGRFGRKHILLFGDLLQLPPVHEEPPFVMLSNRQVEKLIGGLGSVDLWSALFNYDELTINMRQKGDLSYRDMLSRIRIGVVNTTDTKVLETRKMQFVETTIDGRLRELCDDMDKLPSDTVCLLPTCAQCDILNAAILSRIPFEEIKLVARDTVDCVSYMKKKVSKMLLSDEEDSSRTAGLAKVITVKMNARIMIRRNIDVTLGLVNGAIAKIVSFRRAIDTNDVESIKVVLPSGVEYTLERLSVKFEIMDGAFVIRKQFPICLSYGITIHKSRGLRLKNALVEAGNSTFSCGQTYAAFSRATTLQGLHLINYDPASVKANEKAITEYNRLRRKYRSDLATIDTVKTRGPKIGDSVWAVHKNILNCQEKNHDNEPLPFYKRVRGLPNIDGVSSYANGVLQCIIHCSSIRDAILHGKIMDASKSFIETYMLNNEIVIDTSAVRKLASGKGIMDFTGNCQHDVISFIHSLCEKVSAVRSVVEHKLTKKQWCSSCGYRWNFTESSNIILSFELPTSSNKKSLTLQDIFNYNTSKWKSSHASCKECGDVSLLETAIVELTRQVLVVKLEIFEFRKAKLMKKNIKIRAVPTSSVKVNDYNYKVTSVIFHHGEDENKNIRYRTMVRGKGTTWIFIDDLTVEQRNWPCNSKDAYLLFLERDSAKI